MGADSPEGLLGRIARQAVRLVPARLRKRLDDRLFHAVGHVTRVTNDGYPQPDGAVPPPGPAEPEEPLPVDLNRDLDT